MLIVPVYSFDDAPQPNVVFMGAQGEHTPQKIAWIREASKRADIVASNCTGAFLLAQTGLLDGLSATTHHDYYEKFARQFPKVHLVRGLRYVEYEKIATGGGLTSGIELALRIVERYYGTTVADQTAYYMEYARSPQRPKARIIT
jgi:transcriptional regulator GlxA family with amidase domain